MQPPVTEEQVRTVAYRLWEEAGCPEGKADEFWDRARQELGMNETSDDAETIEPTDDLGARGS